MMDRSGKGPFIQIPDSVTLVARRVHVPGVYRLIRLQVD